MLRSGDSYLNKGSPEGDGNFAVLVNCRVVISIWIKDSRKGTETCPKDPFSELIESIWIKDPRKGTETLSSLNARLVKYQIWIMDPRKGTETRYALQQPDRFLIIKKGLLNDTNVLKESVPDWH